MVVYTVFKQIWYYCFCAISSRELFVCLISYDFSNYEVLVMNKMMIRIKMVILFGHHLLHLKMMVMIKMMMIKMVIKVWPPPPAPLLPSCGHLQA